MKLSIFISIIWYICAKYVLGVIFLDDSKKNAQICVVYFASFTQLLPKFVQLFLFIYYFIAFKNENEN